MSQQTENAGVAAPNRNYIERPDGVPGQVSLWLSRLAGQVRRQYLSRLRPDYVARMKARRQGECRRCGACCDLTFHCPFLTNGGDCTGCRIYDKRTRTCRDFPIDARDLKLTRVPCGHYYEETPAEPRA